MTLPNSGDFPPPHNQGTPSNQPPHGGTPYGPGQPGGHGPAGPGAPGGPGSPGYPGGPGGPHLGAAAPQPEKKPRNIRAIISAIVLVAVLGFGAFQWYSNSQRDQALTVGECVSVAGDVDDVDIAAANCDDDDSDGVLFYVISVHESSARCEEPMVEYYETQSSRRGGSEQTTKTVCLGEVLHLDRCYEDHDSVSGLRGVDCPGGLIEVTQVLDEADGECRPEELPLAYDQWPRTYCLAEV